MMQHKVFKKRQELKSLKGRFMQPEMDILESPGLK